jgi:hypothetical protein
MAKTVKVRKRPSSSATKFSLGTKKKGNDGDMWKIVQNKNGTKRWLKISNKSNFILLILLPISLLIGTLISEIIINLIAINFLISCFINCMVFLKM